MKHIVLSEIQSSPAESYGFSVVMGVKDDVVLTKGEKSYHFDYSKDAALFLIGYEVAKTENKYVTVNVVGDSWAKPIIENMIEELQKAQKSGVWGNK